MGMVGWSTGTRGSKRLWFIKSPVPEQDAARARCTQFLRILGMPHVDIYAQSVNAVAVNAKPTPACPTFVAPDVLDGPVQAESLQLFQSFSAAFEQTLHERMILRRLHVRPRR